MRKLACTAVLSVCLVTACASGRPSTPVVPTPGPITTLVPTLAPGAPEPSLPVASSTYKDEVNGFELDYPADWSVSPNQQLGSRGSQAGLFSPGSTAEAVAPGGARLMITVYEWDPKDDLAAYVEHRRAAWDASGFTVRNGSITQRVDGEPASDFFVETTDGLLFYSLLTTNGQQYLELSGEGDLVIVEAIARTLRPLGYNTQ